MGDEWAGVDNQLRRDLRSDNESWSNRYSMLQRQSDAYFNLGKELQRKLDAAEAALSEATRNGNAISGYRDFLQDEIRVTLALVDPESTAIGGDALILIRKQLALLIAALAHVERWDLPDSGRKWDDGTPMSYSAAYGSNGARDYMRLIARTALAGVRTGDLRASLKSASDEVARWPDSKRESADATCDGDTVQP